MSSRNKMMIALMMLVAAVVILPGCGGGGSTSASSPSGETKDTSDSTAAKPDNKYMKYGSEASVEELEAADLILEKNLKAREEGDWAAQCATLTKRAIKNLEEPAVIQKRKRGCAINLHLLAEPLKTTKALRKDNMSGSVTALRVEGDKAFAVFSDAKGNEFVMPMKKVGRTWKVDALLATEVEK